MISRCQLLIRNGIVCPVLVHPVPQSAGIDTQLTGNFCDRPVTLHNELDRLSFELRTELPPRDTCHVLDPLSSRDCPKTLVHPTASSDSPVAAVVPSPTWARTHPRNVCSLIPSNRLTSRRAAR